MSSVLDTIRREYPHLYDVQREIDRVRESTGFGDVSLVFTLMHGVVERGEILSAAKRLYYRRNGNKLERVVSRVATND